MAGFILCLVLLAFEMCWRIHREMVSEHTGQWDYGGVAEFIREFRKQKWEGQKPGSRSLHSHSDNSQIHADIIEFNGKGMVLRRRAWLWFLFWKRIHIHQDGHKRGLWK